METYFCMKFPENQKNHEVYQKNPLDFLKESLSKSQGWRDDQIYSKFRHVLHDSVVSFHFCELYLVFLDSAQNFASSVEKIVFLHNIFFAKS